MSRIKHTVISFVFRAVGKWYCRPKFMRWLILEDIKYNIVQAIAKKEDSFPNLIASYVAIAFRLPVSFVSGLRWDYVMSLFGIASLASKTKIELPFLKPGKSKDKKEPWDYPKRTIYLYSHIIAKHYGWKISDIEKLDVDYALALLQEILTDEQLDREFLWSMSENSYIYDAKTKSGKPNPLERPYWMLEKVQEPRKVTIPASMLPAGVDYSAVGEYAPKEIEVIKQAEAPKPSGSMEFI